MRAQHGAKPLIWSDSLAEGAQSWAQNCKFSHTNGALGPYGDNIAAGTGLFTAKAAVARFTGESCTCFYIFLSTTFISTVGLMTHFYGLDDPNRPVFNHLTQVIWKNTTEVGCGVGLCTNIIPNKVTTLHVCLYNPVGNVVGQERSVIAPMSIRHLSKM